MSDSGTRSDNQSIDQPLLESLRLGIILNSYHIHIPRDHAVVCFDFELDYFCALWICFLLAYIHLDVTKENKLM